MNRSLDRREFVKLAGAAGVVAATAWESRLAAQQAPAPGPDAGEKDLVMLALDAARSAGAGYADVRITHGNTERVAARERQITNVGRAETYGIGVRALVGGSWGFAATRELTRDAVAATARQAVNIAAGNDKINP
jgi:TldD protein